MKGKDRTGIKRFGAYQHVPANTSETLQSAGASLWVTAESEVVAASPSRGCPCCLGSPGDASRPKLTAFPKVGGCGMRKDTSEVNSDLCDRQAPVSSFHTEEHQGAARLLTGRCGPAARRDWWCWGMGTVTRRGEGWLCGPLGWGSRMPALGSAQVCTSLCRMITATHRTGHRYPRLNKA